MRGGSDGPLLPLAGDRSDVFLVDAGSRRILWRVVSRIGDDEMRTLLRQITDRLGTCHPIADDPALRDEIDRCMAAAETRDDPAVDTGPAPPTGLALIEEPKADAERHDGLRGGTPGVRHAS